MLLSLSPLDVGFSRAVLTETLAIGTTEWVLAELILSLAERRLRLVPLGLALVAAIFIRYDAILLCLLTAGVGFHLHRFGTAVRRGAVVALIVTLPLTGWMYRSVAVGLSYFPSPATTREELPYASHIMQWGMTWIDTPEQMARFGWPLLGGSYSSMRVPPSAYVTKAEREEVERLLAALSRRRLKPVPSEIENAFAALAIARRRSYPLTVFVYKPIMRVISLWGDVYSSYGWPIGFRTSQSVKIADAITHGGARGWVAMITKYPLQVTGKILLSGYKFLVILIFILALLLRHANLPRQMRELLILFGAYAVVRTALLASGLVPTMEIRYIVETLPGLQVGCAVAIMFWMSPRPYLTDNLSNTSNVRLENSVEE